MSKSEPRDGKTRKQLYSYSQVRHTNKALRIFCDGSKTVRTDWLASARSEGAVKDGA